MWPNDLAWKMVDYGLGKRLLSIPQSCIVCSGRGLVCFSTRIAYFAWHEHMLWRAAFSRLLKKGMQFGTGKSVRLIYTVALFRFAMLCFGMARQDGYTYGSRVNCQDFQKENLPT